jgi:predicted membrane protein DUF2254
MVGAACGLAYIALNTHVDFPRGVWFLFSGTGRQAPEFLSRVRAGHHVVDGVIAAAVAPAQSATAGLEQTVLESIAVASARTIVQDLEFPARHLVEVAVRALSPGINDVYTALAAIDRLSTSLRKMMGSAAECLARPRRPHPRRRADPDLCRLGRRIVQSNPSERGRQAGDTWWIRSELLQQANPEQRTALERHLRLLLEAGRREIPAAGDLRDLEDHASVALEPELN